MFVVLLVHNGYRGGEGGEILYCCTSLFMNLLYGLFIMAPWGSGRGDIVLFVQVCLRVMFVVRLVHNGSVGVREEKYCTVCTYCLFITRSKQKNSFSIL
jgi:hypothetical protein